MNNCFMFVEGAHDQMFFDNILSPFLMKEKEMIVISIPYQQKSNRKVNKDIASKSQNYFFLSDLDSHIFPCISSRKSKRLNEYNNLDFSKIIIVKEEIESWYLAGIDDSLKQFKDWSIPEDTSNITKNDFDKMLKENSIDSKIDFLKEISKYYNFDLAMNRNGSFRYFMNRLMNFHCQ